LVLFAFKHGNPGDIFVQKAPAATIETLAKALIDLFKSKTKIKVIGTRHGEKMHETLLTTEEREIAEDLGGYYRIPSDNRDLNYDKYFEEGEGDLEKFEPYTSENTRRLNVDEMKDVLLKLNFVKRELENF
jgi:UDP-glucose 4-epimerase